MFFQPGSPYKTWLSEIKILFLWALLAKICKTTNAIFQIKRESVTPVSESSYDSDTAHCKFILLHLM